MKATLANTIRISHIELPVGAHEEIQRQLTVPNPAKALAERELLWGASRMDPWMRLYSYDNRGYMFLPIGFKHALTNGLSSMGVTIDWEDQRTCESFAHVTWPKVPIPVELRDYQEPMVQAMLDKEVGVVEAPTAAGKTVVALEAIRRSGQHALIIVEKAALAKQWVAAIRDKLGIEPGYIGEREADIKPITVALRQALWAQKDLLELWDRPVWGPGNTVANLSFFASWGAVVVDEAHHAATAQTLIEIIQLFSPRYLWGPTATPDRDPEYFPVLQAVIGPVIFETTEADAGAHLMTPRIRVLESSFEFDYEPTHEIRLENGGKRVVRNNYTAMMAALEKDDDRNLLIARAAREEADAGHHVLIVSSRKNHLERIGNLLVTHTPYVLVGGSGGDEAMEVRDEIHAAKQGTVLLSTIADEGLSIERLDRVILAYPRRNPETIRQIVGRIRRQYPGKSDAVLIDVRDGKQDLLTGQFRGRAQELYGREGWVIER